ncbi:hypothetical protein EOI86_09420 [Hwanghaeella grinnelliae]|uniref:Uncharacterized protein n=1 Tax=Hwanghaeella grinnelliae TaxID=2500179 RepID=A0A3S2VSG3_9PROT|nr:hypothetical protein [Hwanghaeella grinnelliae]RVU39436.1 hypothetical protein EOI86_09420 [Hwanghaeella grinnelliae]
MKSEQKATFRKRIRLGLAIAVLVLFTFAAVLFYLGDKLIALPVVGLAFVVLVFRWNVRIDPLAHKPSEGLNEWHGPSHGDAP